MTSCFRKQRRMVADICYQHPATRPKRFALPWLPAAWLFNLFLSEQDREKHSTQYHDQQDRKPHPAKSTHAAVAHHPATHHGPGHHAAAKQQRWQEYNDNENENDNRKRSLGYCIYRIYHLVEVGLIDNCEWSALPSIGFYQRSTMTVIHTQFYTEYPTSSVRCRT